ncbi:hypothetical protein Apa02nite_083430 [Actinoplanes palleronii]|uniref:Uncharacterized protein n=2 Tax=Actinoplanes palleronii TaxID=113570 RepID=A0ABQ4BPS7_9ACTN|nr:hypothetical protein Apa02nite_083430 [Actinoplanes palleronii]
MAVASWVAVLAAVSSPAVPAAEAGPRFDLARTVARWDALARSITGDVAELRASERLNYRRAEGGIAECMRAHGRPYQKAPFISLYRDFTDADVGYGNGSATIVDSLTAGTSRFELNEYAWLRARRADVLKRRARPADMGVANRCALVYQYRSYLDIVPPANAYRLIAFQDLVPPLYRDPTVAKAWRTYDGCMNGRHGYVPGMDRSDFLFIALRGVPGSPEWQSKLTELKAVLATDVECRRPAYLAAMRLLDERLDGWEQKHRAELLAIRREWRERVAAAARLPR